MFFMQASLDSYNKTIYARQLNIIGSDPVVKYENRMRNAKQKTGEAYLKLKELLNARTIQ